MNTHSVAPEVLQHDKFGSASDVWGAGCCAYEMLSLKYVLCLDGCTQLCLDPPTDVCRARVIRNNFSQLFLHVCNEFIWLHGHVLTYSRSREVLGCCVTLTCCLPPYARLTYVKSNASLFFLLVCSTCKYECEQEYRDIFRLACMNALHVCVRILCVDMFRNTPCHRQCNHPCVRSPAHENTHQNTAVIVKKGSQQRPADCRNNALLTVATTPS